MLSEGKSDAEILAALNAAFPPGKFSTSHRQALAGTKWDLGKTGTRAARSTSQSLSVAAGAAQSAGSDEREV